MAYVSKEKKAKVQTALKSIIPSTWRWSLAVEHHSTLRLTIAAGPQELAILSTGEVCQERSINHYYIDREFSNNPKLENLFKEITAAMNTDNFDNSDIMTDYFHVGHYVSIQIGRWNKPFIVQS